MLSLTAEYLATSKLYPYNIGYEATPGGGTRDFKWRGWSKDFFRVWKFRFRDFFGYENLASIFWGSLIWVVKLFVMFLPRLVLFRVIHNITVEKKPFLGVSRTRSSFLKWLPDEGKDIFRWYDE